MEIHSLARELKFDRIDLIGSKRENGGSVVDWSDPESNKTSARIIKITLSTALKSVIIPRGRNHREDDYEKQKAN